MSLVPGLEQLNTVKMSVLCNALYRFRAIPINIPLEFFTEIQDTKDEWIKKIWNIHTVEYHPALKKKEILVLKTTWMNLEDTILSEITDTVRQILYDHIYMWNLKQTQTS